jgi:methyltransferase
MPLVLVIAILAGVLLIMLGETILSRHNERVLRARGAVEPAEDVYPYMQVAYPGAFVAMAGEGAFSGPADDLWLLGGAVLFGWAKALKFWAIATLGLRWTYRVLVLPGAPLVSSGPYRYVRHPNYVAVVGEFVAMAIMMAAPVTGILAILGFGVLLRRRIRIEEQALGMR